MQKKYRDPETFTVPCTIGECTFADAMLDLGILTNVMPSLVYRLLKFGDLEPTGVIIQLANRSITHLFGILEGVLVQVNELIFQVDFYVLDVEDEPSSKGSTLILSRPFLMTARTKIDVHAETLSMEFDNNMMQFNIFKVMKHPTENHFVVSLDVIDLWVNNYMEMHFGLSSFSEFTYFANFADVGNLVGFECTCDGGNECFVCAKMDAGIDANPKGCSKPTSLTSIMQPPTLELKSLSEHLKYAYLEDNQKFPIIITNNLHSEQRERLLQVLRKNWKAIGWTLAYLLGINPSICIHMILLEEEA
ncbi:hypothetical protein CR513_24958, partial [Mucuna pruriens]